MALVRGVVLSHLRGGDELARTAAGTCPHVLPLANRPLVHYAVAAMRSCGIREVAVVVAPTPARTSRAPWATATPGG